MDLGELSAGVPGGRADPGSAQLERCRFVTTELREHEWNPMLANPGRAIYLLLAREFAPLPSRLRSLAGRLAAVPEALAAARSMAAARLPRVHLETAISQFAGTERLIGPELDRTLAGAPDGWCRPTSPRRGRGAGRDRGASPLAGAAAGGRHPGRGFRDPRIGPELFARKLSS